MPSSGGGQVTPVVIEAPVENVYDQSEELLSTPNCAVPLPRYAKLLNYEEAAFWGVVTENRWERGGGPLWKEGERMVVQLALAQSQQQIESFIGYPMCKTWVAGRVQDVYNNDLRWVDQQVIRCAGRIVTKYPRLIEPGIRATQMVETGAVLTFGTKLATVGPIAVTFTDPREVKIYYPDSDRRIEPSRVVISGGNLTIQIPRYRLVITDLLNTPEGGILYEPLENFLSTVDVVRVYTDPSTQAIFVRPNCRNNNCSGGCTECTQTGCMYLLDPEIGYVDVRPATWDVDAEEWNSKIVCRTGYSRVRLHYACGMEYLTPEAEKVVISLAHSKLYGPPCSSDAIVDMWKKDNEIPRMLTRERINCPFGTSNGAWNAYLWAKQFKSVRASIL